MTDLNQAIANSLNATTAQFGDVANFIGEQGPQLFNEIIRWHTFASSSISILTFFVIKETIKYDYKLYKKEYPTDDEKVVAFFINVFGLAMPSIFFLHHVFNLLKMTIAPKLWMMQYVADFLKN